MPQTLEEFARGTPFLEEVNRLREVERHARRVVLLLEGARVDSSLAERAKAAAAVNTLRIVLRLPEVR